MTSYGTTKKKKTEFILELLPTDVYPQVNSALPTDNYSRIYIRK